MKGETMPAIVKIDRVILQELTKEVKETLAADLLNSNKQNATRKFSATDLWKIHQNKRSVRLNHRASF